MSWEKLRPQWGLVLGSGLGGFTERMHVDAVVPYAEIAGLPQTRVTGHAGQFVFGTLGSIPIVTACGRVHLYEGMNASEVTANVRWMAGRGITKLLLTNAAGSCNREFAPASWMILTDHLNLTGTSPLIGRANFIDMSGIYSAKMRNHFRAEGQSQGVALHEGVYAGLIGPQYETPAEIRMLQMMGADAVGMSTVLEAIQAHALGLEVGAFSCLTNWAAGLGQAPLAHREVVTTGADAAPKLADLLSKGIPSFP